MSAFGLGTITTSRKDFPVLCARFFVRPLDNSACFEAKEGKSSPNSHDFALGRGSSARFILDRFMAARNSLSLFD